jgi:hypothetical protein
LLEGRVTVATAKQIEENEKELDTYAQKEAQAIQQIISTVNDRILLLIEELESPTAVQVWKLVCGEYESKSELVVADRRRRLQGMCCEDRDDVITHLTAMRTAREELASLGAKVEDTDFVAIIQGSMPESYRSVHRNNHLSDRQGRLNTWDTHQPPHGGSGAPQPSEQQAISPRRKFRLLFRNQSQRASVEEDMG